jgi:hypothetical protein
LRAPDGFDGVPHLTPEGKPLPVKLSLATVKILFSRGWALYREDSTLSMPELLRAALVHFVEPVEVIRKVKLMVGIRAKHQFGFVKLSTSG